ncbi:MAG: hypothetical protein NVSMB26_12880 [Beijerinckiaceae bacterium]
MTFRVPAFPAVLEPSAGSGTIGARSRVMKSAFARFLKDESGATAIEYGLLAALISVVIIGAITAVGSKLSGKFNTIAGNLT